MILWPISEVWSLQQKPRHVHRAPVNTCHIKTFINLSSFQIKNKIRRSRNPQSKENSVWLVQHSGFYSNHTHHRSIDSNRLLYKVNYIYIFIFSFLYSFRQRPTLQNQVGRGSSGSFFHFFTTFSYFFYSKLPSKFKAKETLPTFASNPLVQNWHWTFFTQRKNNKIK